MSKWHVEERTSKDGRWYIALLRDDRRKIVCLGFGKKRSEALESLSRHAQGMYVRMDRDCAEEKRWPVVSLGELPYAQAALMAHEHKSGSAI